MALRFDEHYRETAKLRDGTRVTLRCVRPSDKELLRRGFERLSPESRYRRFLFSKKQLTDEELAYLTEVDGLDHFALGATATDPEGEECGLAIARFVRSRSDPRTAEPAVAVADDWQHRGLGTLLLHRLVAAACERGIDHFQSIALATNSPLLEILEPIGDEAELLREGDSVVIRVDLPSVLAHFPTVGRKSPLDRVLELAARGLVAVGIDLERLRPGRGATGARTAVDDATP